MVGESMIRVLVGVPTAEMARRAAFYDYYHALQLPMGALATFVHGQSIAYNRNKIVEQALENGCSHIFMLDDDTVFDPDILIRLLCHNVDLVTGLMLMRDYPHKPLIFSRFVGGAAEHIFLNGQSGLIPIAASGLGCVLIKTKVFSKLEEPFFRYGELDSDGLGEDLGFFKRVQDIGLQHYCDLDALVGHSTNVTVRAKVNTLGTWSTIYENNNGVVGFPAVQRPEGV
jgi:hypothetical protein